MGSNGYQWQTKNNKKIIKKKRKKDSNPVIKDAPLKCVKCTSKKTFEFNTFY
jgi:hypothetical protein